MMNSTLLRLSALALWLLVFNISTQAAPIEGPDATTRKAATVGTTNGALDTYDRSGYIDFPNGAARIEKCQCDYEVVAASQTDQVLGVTGATGDYLERLIIVPTTTSPGAVSIKDGSGSAITVFTGGATSVQSLVPIPLEFNWTSTAGAWKVTTGTNVSVLGGGRFTP